MTLLLGSHCARMVQRSSQEAPEIRRDCRCCCRRVFLFLVSFFSCAARRTGAGSLPGRSHQPFVSDGSCLHWSLGALAAVRHWLPMWFYHTSHARMCLRNWSRSLEISLALSVLVNILLRIGGVAAMQHRWNLCSQLDKNMFCMMCSDTPVYHLFCVSSLRSHPPESRDRMSSASQQRSCVCQLNWC